MVTKKFVFDLDFETTPDKDIFKPEERRYTKQEFDAAALAHYEKGKQEGCEETLASIDKQKLELLEKINQCLLNIAETQAKQYDQQFLESLTVLKLFLKKLLTKTTTEQHLTEVEAFLKECFDALFLSQNVEIKVHPDLKQDVAAMITKLSHAKNDLFHCHIVEDETLMLGDCYIEWPFGKAVRAQKDTYEVVENLIDKILDGFGGHK